MNINNQILQDARTLWDFHVGHFGVERADFILALGSHDERIAEYAAKLYLAGLAPWLVTSGGFGKVTRHTWRVTEGEKFAMTAEGLGVPRSAIIVEADATNTGDNVTKTRDILEARGIHVATGILVTKPYMCRRAYATAAKQWPEIKWLVAAPPLTFDEYPNDEVPLDRMINLMVGDLQRLRVYGEKGFQIPVEVPESVWSSYERLRDAGYDEFVIPAS